MQPLDLFKGINDIYEGLIFEFITSDIYACNNNFLVSLFNQGFSFRNNVLKFTASRGAQRVGQLFEETLLAWDEPTRWTYRIDRCTAPLAHAQVESTELRESGAGGRIDYFVTWRSELVFDDPGVSMNSLSLAVAFQL